MTLAPIVATDTGYLFSRVGVNAWRPVLNVGTHSPGANLMFSVVHTPNDPRQVWVFDITHSRAWASTDGGLTWTEVAGFAEKDNVIYPKDESGRLYGTHGSDIFRSSDNGATWDLIVVLDHGFGAGITGFASGQMFAIDGTLFIPALLVEPPSTFYELVVCDYDGDGLHNTGQDLPVPFSNIVVRGQVGADSVYSYSSGEGPGSPALIWWNKASDPSGLTFSLFLNPFPPQQLVCIGVVSDTVAIAHTLAGQFDYSSGAIWRTDDTGVTWTEVQSLDPRLAGGGGVNLNSVTVVADPSLAGRVWVASQSPWVFRSDDAGLTWTVETVAGPEAAAATGWSVIGLGTGQARAPRVFAQVIG